MKLATTPKEAIYARTDEEMERHLQVATSYGVTEKIALTCRMLANDGHGSGLAGQITVRGDDPATFWTQRFGLGMDEVKASNVLLWTAISACFRARAWQIRPTAFTCGSTTHDRR
jgi:L-fuculose-phosphate aldolase